jgi:hypothetical protein
VKLIEQRAFSGCKNLKAVYYKNVDLSNVEINDDAVQVQSRVYFYSENIPVTEGKFWHYVDGVPTAW